MRIICCQPCHGKPDVFSSSNISSHSYREQLSPRDGYGCYSLQLAWMILADVLLMKADVKQAERKLRVRQLYSFVTV